MQRAQMCRSLGGLGSTVCAWEHRSLVGGGRGAGQHPQYPGLAGNTLVRQDGDHVAAISGSNGGGGSRGSQQQGSEGGGHAAQPARQHHSRSRRSRARRSLAGRHQLRGGGGLQAQRAALVGRNVQPERASVCAGRGGKRRGRIKGGHRPVGRSSARQCRQLTPRGAAPKATEWVCAPVRSSRARVTGSSLS